MTDKHWIDDHHYEVRSPDGRRSYLYRIGDSDAHPARLIEIVDHRRTPRA